MRNKAKDLAAAIVFVCVAIIAACGDEANIGNPAAMIAACICIIIAGITSEISWHGYLDGWDEVQDADDD